MSREDLSAKSGVDLAVLERIEKDEEQPIIASLIQLSKALQVNVADIFRHRPVRQNFEIIRKNDGKRVRPHEHSEANLFDYSYELLTTPSDDKHLDAYLIEVPPLQTKIKSSITHSGEEFVYILEGEIEGEIAGEKFYLKAGDSLFLFSTAPHVFYNPGEVIARAVAVIYPY